MPFNYAHALLAQRAVLHTGGAAEAAALASQPAFRAGAMGPDPYFADALPRPLLSAARTDLASRLHALDAGVLFGSLLPLAETPVQQAYALGFLCHFLLDTHAHPFICARFPGKRHTPGEMHLDLPALDRLGADFSDEKPWRYFALRTSELDELETLHAGLIRTLFQEDSRGVFYRSYRKWIHLVSRLTFDPAGRKRRFFSRLERLFSKPGRLSSWLVTRDATDGANDHMNLQHAVWSAPWADGTPQTASFPDLFSDALQEAPALLAAAAEGFGSGDFTVLIQQLSGRCMDGQPIL